MTSARRVTGMMHRLVIVAFAVALLGASPAVSLVDPFVGTSGTKIGGPIDTFPGADAPFGMVQWSPDTPAQPAGGGYDYADSAIAGFSLTHLSGPGCSVFGDFGILPTVGTVRDPMRAKAPFSHRDESASPGEYAVTLDDPPIGVRLTVTPRTGLGEFTFPSTRKANLLFNVSSDQAGVTDASFAVVNDREVQGMARSGNFCGMPGLFTVYLDAQFNRPFVAHGTWLGNAVKPGASTARGVNSGGYVTFDASADRTVEAKVSVSWVSAAGARGNIAAEGTTWDFATVRKAVSNAWSSLLGRIAITGGTAEEQRVFYTALYHALLHPNVFSDADGRYRGFDGVVHLVPAGHAEYANFSGWDIYRSQIALIALLAPRRTSDMMQSLVDDAHQGGWLPKWPLANTYTAVMGGDSADPILAGAYAFGARDFDTRAALAAMVRGATDTTSPPGQGWYVERSGLRSYLRDGYVANTLTTNVSPVPNGASMTLEYALDDFSISRFARALHDESVARAFAKRAQNWTTLFDTALGEIAPRDGDGAFERTPITDNGQSGFQEGNAAQYTWMVPQDLAGLVYGMGGGLRTIYRLNDFFLYLDVGQNQPFAWFGNEPTLASAWTYLYAGAPYREQAVTRRVLTTLYKDSPEGIPGNDDLGTMSAWYVWNAIGLYPIDPSVRQLLIGTPLFTTVDVRVPGGPEIVVSAPQVSDATPYMQSVLRDGKTWRRTWTWLPLHGTLRLDEALGSAPSRWGAPVSDAPPSFGGAFPHFPPATEATLTVSRATIDLAPGGSATIPFELANVNGNTAVNVAWTAQAPNALHLSARSGTLDVGAKARSGGSLSVATGSAPSGIYDVVLRARAQNGALLPRATAVVRVVGNNAPARLGFVANFAANTITPIDPRTLAFGAPIAVGANPGGLALSPDDSRLYVANQGSNTVSVIDTDSLKVIATVHVGKVPAGIAVTPDGKSVWVTNYNDNTVQPIDTATLKAGAAISVGSSPEDLAIAPDGSRLYVANQGDGTITPVDITTRRALAPIRAGAKPLGIAVARDGATVYVGSQGRNVVVPVDVKTGVAGTPIPVGQNPQSLEISPDGRTLYVANSGTTTITPIDLTTQAAEKPIAVGDAPFDLAFSADGAMAFVVNSADNDCVPVDLRTGKTLEPIPVGAAPLAIVITR